MLHGMTMQDHRGNVMTLGRETGLPAWQVAPLGDQQGIPCADLQTPRGDLDMTQRALIRRSYLRVISAVGFGLGLLWAAWTLG